MPATQLALFTQFWGIKQHGIVKDYTQIEQQ